MLAGTTGADNDSDNSSDSFISITALGGNNNNGSSNGGVDENGCPEEYSHLNKYVSFDTATIYIAKTKGHVYRCKDGPLFQYCNIFPPDWSRTSYGGGSVHTTDSLGWELLGDCEGNQVALAAPEADLDSVWPPGPPDWEVNPVSPADVGFGLDSPPYGEVYPVSPEDTPSTNGPGVGGVPSDGPLSTNLPGLSVVAPEPPPAGEGADGSGGKKPPAASKPSPVPDEGDASSSLINSGPPDYGVETSGLGTEEGAPSPPNRPSAASKPAPGRPFRPLRPGRPARPKKPSAEGSALPPSKAGGDDGDLPPDTGNASGSGSSPSDPIVAAGYSSAFESASGGPPDYGVGASGPGAEGSSSSSSSTAPEREPLVGKKPVKPKPAKPNPPSNRGQGGGEDIEGEEANNSVGPRPDWLGKPERPSKPPSDGGQEDGRDIEADDIEGDDAGGDSTRPRPDWLYKPKPATQVQQAPGSINEEGMLIEMDGIQCYRSGKRCVSDAEIFACCTRCINGICI